MQLLGKSVKFYGENCGNGYAINSKNTYQFGYIVSAGDTTIGLTNDLLMPSSLKIGGITHIYTGDVSYNEGKYNSVNYYFDDSGVSQKNIVIDTEIPNVVMADKLADSHYITSDEYIAKGNAATFTFACLDDSGHGVQNSKCVVDLSKIKVDAVYTNSSRVGVRSTIDSSAAILTFNGNSLSVSINESYSNNLYIH